MLPNRSKMPDGGNGQNPVPRATLSLGTQRRGLLDLANAISKSRGFLEFEGLGSLHHLPLQLHHTLVQIKQLLARLDRLPRRLPRRDLLLQVPANRLADGLRCDPM